MDKISAAFAFLALFVFIFVAFAVPESGTHWLVCLLGLPPIIQFFGWIILSFRDGNKDHEETFCRFYDVTMFLSNFFYCGAWYIYVKQERISIGWSYLCLVFVFALLMIIMFITYAIMRSEVSTSSSSNGNFLKNLRNSPKLKKYLVDLKLGLSELQFWALLHFIAIFLSVTYLFGFALAFHDRNQQDKGEQEKRAKTTGKSDDTPSMALYMENLRSAKEEAQMREALLTSEPPMQACFYFAEKSSNFESQPNPNEPGPGKNIQTLYDENRKYKNFQALTGISNYIKQAGKGKSARITLRGRASDKQVGTNNPYPNNNEISRARAQSAASEILTKLSENDNPPGQSEDPNKKKNPPEIDNSDSQKTQLYIFWSSNEDKPKLCPAIEDGNTDSNKRVTEVSVQVLNDYKAEDALSPKPMQLFDYMYFSVYTVTTTGYGDIKPLTPYAKFICSLANLFEVFFLVAFLNALISLRGSGRS